MTRKAKDEPVARMDLTTLRRLYNRDKQDKHIGEIAKLYKSTHDFRRFDFSIFEAARRRGILEEITQHMAVPYKPNPKFGRKSPNLFMPDKPPLTLVGGQKNKPGLRVVTHYLAGTVPDKHVPQPPFGKCLLWEKWITAFPSAKELEELDEANNS